MSAVFSCMPILLVSTICTVTGTALARQTPCATMELTEDQLKLLQLNATDSYLEARLAHSIERHVL